MDSYFTDLALFLVMGGVDLIVSLTFLFQNMQVLFNVEKHFENLNLSSSSYSYSR